MAVDPLPLADAAGGRLPLADWPGLRTLRTPRFRLIVGLSLWACGTLMLAALLVRQAADPAGQFAFDFQAYHAAAADLAAGRSPYAAEMFAGPIPAQGAVLYKYPPLLAQMLVPLAALPLAAAATVWLAGQWLAMLAGTWLAARAGGANASLSSVVWSGAAVSFFLPCFDTLWKGNVSGILLLAVAVALAGGVAAGLGTGVAALVKTTPSVLVLPVVAAGGRGLRALALWLPVVGLSVLIAPLAWWDFARVLPNLISGPELFVTNLSPHSLVAFAMPDLPVLADLARLVSIATGVAALGGAVILARRPARWPPALALAVVALLLLPSATWYHYLAVLLPLAAFAWPRAGTPARAALAGGGALISVGVAWLPLAVAGSAIVIIAAVRAMLRPAVGGVPAR